MYIQTWSIQVYKVNFKGQKERNTEQQSKGKNNSKDKSASEIKSSQAITLNN